MVWPFSRKKDPAPRTTETFRAPAAHRPREDDAILDDIKRWLAAHLPAESVAHIDGDAVLHVGKPKPGVRTTEVPPAGAVLRVKKGKLAWIDLYDPGLRDPLNRLVKHLDQQQKWSFNGVVSTKYVEPKP